MSGIKEFQKGSNVQLTASFNSNEFDCNCKKSECKITLIDINHVKKLQELRNKWKKPIIITSAYRCKEFNKEVGGATQSRHTFGDATDIVVKGLTPDEVAEKCDIIFNGLGRYSSFTHIDSRPGIKSRWDFRGL